jgi:hypothetical protein
MKENQKKLIEEWKFRLNRAQIGHYSSSENYDSWQKIVGVCSVVLSSIVMSILFFDFNILQNNYIKITLSILSILVAIASALQTFLAPGEKSERHRHRAVKYGALRRRLELYIANENSDEEVSKFLYDINREWDLVTEDAPVTPKNIRDKIPKVLKDDIDSKNEFNQ